MAEQLEHTTGPGVHVNREALAEVVALVTQPGSVRNVDLHRSATRAALAYDEAIRACANDPEKMASFCSAHGDNLDSLYAKWITLARLALDADKAETGEE